MPYTNFRDGGDSRPTRRSSRLQFPRSNAAATTSGSAHGLATSNIPRGSYPARLAALHASQASAETESSDSHDIPTYQGDIDISPIAPLDLPHDPNASYLPQFNQEAPNLPSASHHPGALRLHARLQGPSHEDGSRSENEDQVSDLESGRPSDPQQPSGFFAHLQRFYDKHDDKLDDDDGKDGDLSPRSSDAGSDRSPGFDRYRNDSMMSLDSQHLDPDDPYVTGIRKRTVDDEADLERSVLKQMDYRARRKEKERMRIEFNVTSVLYRQKFLMRLSKALLTFSAPSHRIEAQLVSAARILEIHGEFIHIPGVVICSFGDQDTKTSETHFVKCGGRLNLGSLHQVHLIYRKVVHDEISAREATRQLDELMDAGPLYNAVIRCILAFSLCALICPLAFGGSLVDMLISGIGATFLCGLQIGVASRSQLYANVFEVTVTIAIACAARGLSSIRSQIFCYTAISSAGIVLILPGYLILSSSLELASKNIVCGSVKMVYALIYTLFLGFGLQIGSDFYLLVDHGARKNLEALAARMNAVVSVSGTFVSDNSTSYLILDHGKPLSGTYTFTTNVPFSEEHIFNGCYRPPSFSWYLKPFPWWTQFIIVPIFSTLSSLANQQPLFTRELVVMVVISCTAYAANKVADHYIFNRSDVVSAIGAFAVGLLGNIYSRKMGGTAFTSMVTGVLFLVPSGLSQIGGITAQGNGIDIGGAMIAVTIGITVGLFMSQALVYMFGSRKNAALFSF
ncbi:hypothetical protein EUX98_g6122 [Antrodiella citrinella]|uniref:Threonine/serine exporter-like N-terminal domain-containing protein n=1 Tax=Antrodiella citrinella TaxID=2447956 RepID=A0A4V3XI69_9APHY|nr:hypothetical protein EUX98_g6122 [Antrodiella citrinella]